MLFIACLVPPILLILGISVIPSLAAFALENHRKKALTFTTQRKFPYNLLATVAMWILPPGILLVVWFYLCFYFIQKPLLEHFLNIDPLGTFIMFLIILLAGIIDGTLVFLGKHTIDKGEPQTMHTLGRCAIALGIIGYMLSFLGTFVLSIMLGI